jgi:uncharacterized protein YaaN involved in tellurite resistance
MSTDQAGKTVDASATTLTPPDPVPAVQEQLADQMVPLSKQQTATSDEQVRQFVSEMLAFDMKSPSFEESVERISKIGNDEIARSASISNRMLQRPLSALKSGPKEGSGVGKGLIELRAVIERLDPRRQGDLLSPGKLFGIIPFGNKVLSYFRRFESAQSQINAIVEALYHGKDELLKDNAAIEQERTEMWKLMEKISQCIYLGKHIDSSLTAQLDALDISDSPRAKLLREEVLFYTRQKVTDLLTQMAVNAQGYLALDMIKRNNMELIKGVDRATTTTVSALRTAVVVAQTLTNQRLVLDQIHALRDTTGNLIESTGKMLRQNAGDIMTQASDPAIDLKKIESAFDNIYATVNMISEYRVKALGNMQATVAALSSQVEKAQTYITREQQLQDAVKSLPTTNE